MSFHNACMPQISLHCWFLTSQGTAAPHKQVQLPRIVELRYDGSPLMLFLSVTWFGHAGRKISGHWWSGLVVAEFLRAALQTTSFRRFITQYCELRQSGPWVRSMSIHINVPTIVDAAFLQHVQVCPCGPGHVNVIPWECECFFPHVEVNSKFDVMTTDEVPFDWPKKIVPGFTVIRYRVFLLRPVRFSWIFPIHSSSLKITSCAIPSILRSTLNPGSFCTGDSALRSRFLALGSSGLSVGLPCSSFRASFVVPEAAPSDVFCCCCCCCCDCQALSSTIFCAGRGVESLSKKVLFPFWEITL